VEYGFQALQATAIYTARYMSGLIQRHRAQQGCMDIDWRKLLSYSKKSKWRLTDIE